jgi:hypothetical protein
MIKSIDKNFQKSIPLFLLSQFHFLVVVLKHHHKLPWSYLFRFDTLYVKLLPFELIFFIGAVIFLYKSQVSDVTKIISGVAYLAGGIILLFILIGTIIIMESNGSPNYN